MLFVPSEEPYHKRKVTLLNGPHTVLSPVAFLSGVNIVRDACNHEVISQYIHKVQFDELMQTLDLPMEEQEKFAGVTTVQTSNFLFTAHTASLARSLSTPVSRLRLPSLVNRLALSVFRRRRTSVPGRMMESMLDSWMISAFSPVAMWTK